MYVASSDEGMMLQVAQSDLARMPVANARPALRIYGNASVKLTVSDYTLHVYRSLPDVEEIWRAYEAHSFFTPYQRFDFCAAYFNNIGKAEGEKPLITLVVNKAGQVEMLLPFFTQQYGVLTSIGYTGGKHSNCNIPMISAHCPKFSPERMKAMLHELGKYAKADLYTLYNQPLSRQGVDNPLGVLDVHPSPSYAFELDLQEDSEALISKLLSKDTRKKLRKKEERLAQMGQLTFIRARDSQMAEQIFNAYFEQKSARFAKMGIADPYASKQMRAFLWEAAMDGIENETSVLDLQALKLDDKIIATNAGMRNGQNYAGVFCSYDEDKEIARQSPGEVLIAHLIKNICARGYKFFDLGIGESRYKSTWMDREIALVDLFQPISTLGFIAGYSLSKALQMKKQIKESPKAMAALNQMRKWKAGSLKNDPASDNSASDKDRAEKSHAA